MDIEIWASQVHSLLLSVTYMIYPYDIPIIVNWVPIICTIPKPSAFWFYRPSPVMLGLLQSQAVPQHFFVKPTHLPGPLGPSHAMVRTVQFNRPQTESACVTAMAERASDQAPAPLAARQTKDEAKTMRFPSSSIRLVLGALWVIWL